MASAFATRPDQTLRDKIDRQRFLKDRMDVRIPPTRELAQRVLNALEQLPGAEPSPNQVTLLANLDAGIAELDPQWESRGETCVDREHASNKITKLQAYLDRLVAETTKDIDVLAEFSGAVRGEDREPVKEEDLAF